MTLCDQCAQNWDTQSAHTVTTYTSEFRGNLYKIKIQEVQFQGKNNELEVMDLKADISKHLFVVQLL